MDKTRNPGVFMFFFRGMTHLDHEGNVGLICVVFMLSMTQSEDVEKQKDGVFGGGTQLVRSPI